MRKALSILFLIALPLATMASGCRRNEQGQVVVDEQARKNAQAEAEAKVEEANAAVSRAGEQTKEALNNAADKAETGLEKAGDQLKAGAAAAGKALEMGIDKTAETLEPMIDDATISAKVKAKLLADPEVAGLAIDVDTVNGVVTLNGRAGSAAQRDEAVKLARNTEGVKSVITLLQITAQ